MIYVAPFVATSSYVNALGIASVGGFSADIVHGFVRQCIRSCRNSEPSKPVTEECCALLNALSYFFKPNVGYVSSITVRVNVNEKGQIITFPDFSLGRWKSIESEKLTTLEILFKISKEEEKHYIKFQPENGIGEIDEPLARLLKETENEANEIVKQLIKKNPTPPKSSSIKADPWNLVIPAVKDDPRFALPLISFVQLKSL